jgi:hypothetical protein
MTEKTARFKSDIENKLKSVIVTSNSRIPGHEIVMRLGSVQYLPRDHVDSSLSLLTDQEALRFLKQEALRLGANALINLHKTKVAKTPAFLGPPPPQKFRHFDFPTPLDYVPSYRQEKEQLSVYRRLSIGKEQVVFRAEAVIIRRLKK